MLNYIYITTWYIELYIHILLPDMLNYIYITTWYAELYIYYYLICWTIYILVPDMLNQLMVTGEGFETLLTLMRFNFRSPYSFSSQLHSSLCHQILKKKLNFLVFLFSRLTLYLDLLILITPIVLLFLSIRWV